jgi:SAM-dependent methyltransferase
MTEQSARAFSARKRVTKGLERLGLVGPAYRVVEWKHSLKALPELTSRRRGTAPDGLPLPPPTLRLKVTHTADPDEFLAQGERAVGTIREALSRGGRTLEDLDSVLDFGCGSGRVMRHWARVSGPRFFGSDYNPDLVAWCEENLRFATFRVNGLAPPLPFENDQFDLVYALSVFTHLSETKQQEWLAELARVVRPGGLLLLTTRGDAWRHKLEPEELTRYDAGRLVTRYDAVEGTNLCAAWHPRRYVDERFTKDFRLLDVLPAGLADGLQDVNVLERVDGPA